MTQPTREHRYDIHPRMTIGFGEISHILWQQALDAHEPVGTCTRPTVTSRCGGLMRGLEPDERNGRMFYTAYCATCGREVVGMGPRPAKEAKA